MLFGKSIFSMALVMSNFGRTAPPKLMGTRARHGYGRTRANARDNHHNNKVQQYHHAVLAMICAQLFIGLTGVTETEEEHQESGLFKRAECEDDVDVSKEVEDGCGSTA